MCRNRWIVGSGNILSLVVNEFAKFPKAAGLFLQFTRLEHRCGKLVFYK
jgi:hypothetical protein